MMMLRALAVGAEETTLGFAENEDGSGPALGLQREPNASTYQLVTEYATVEERRVAAAEESRRGSSPKGG